MLWKKEKQILENISQNPNQEKYFQTIALKNMYRGNMDAILKEFSHTENPFLEYFIHQNSHIKNISLTIAEILSERDEKFFKKILHEAIEI